MSCARRKAVLYCVGKDERELERISRRVEGGLGGVIRG